MAVTVKANIIDPQVIADYIDKKLIDNIVFAPLADVMTNLEGVPGSTLYLPAYSYIGAASTVAEGSDIAITNLSASMVSVAVHKIAKGTGFTDEAALSAFGSLEDESARQLTIAIADGVDKEMLTTLEGIAGAMTYSDSTASDIGALINGALELFGEDYEGEKVLLVDPTNAVAIRNTKAWLPASEIAADRMVRGAVGEIFGCQVIVSNRLKNKNEAFIVKPGALKLILKRNAMVEYDRNIVNKTTLLTADEHFATYLYDPNKAIKVDLS